jgi:AcrR family transcriptional regulator
MGATDMLAQMPSERKDAIREAALTLFAERGYKGTSMEDVGRFVGIRGPSLYNHISSKQDVLVDIMMTTMYELLGGFDDANVGRDAEDRLRRIMGAHVSYHALHPRDVRIGNREIPNLDESARNKIVQLRSDYENKWRRLIDSGMEEGAFSVSSTRLAVYAILEMGIGVSQWYRPDGPMSLNQIADQYGEMAARLLGIRPR